MIARHLCLADSLIKLGGALDCPKCWSALETSVELARSEGTFRGDEPPDVLRLVPFDGSLPSSDDPRTCAYCGRQDHACTFCKIEIRKRVEAGAWRVWCSGCSWSESGPYSEVDRAEVEAHVDGLGRDHFETVHRQDEDGHG